MKIRKQAKRRFHNRAGRGMCVYAGRDIGVRWGWQVRVYLEWHGRRVTGRTGRIWRK